MKKLFLICFSLFVFNLSFAQTYKYCTIIATVKQLNDNIKKVKIDFGNDSIVVLNDVTLADACNYVGNQGYELVSSYIKYGDWDHHYLYFKKEIKKEEN